MEIIAINYLVAFKNQILESDDEFYEIDYYK